MKFVVEEYQIYNDTKSFEDYIKKLSADDLYAYMFYNKDNYNDKAYWDLAVKYMIDKVKKTIDVYPDTTDIYRKKYPDAYSGRMVNKEKKPYNFLDIKAYKQTEYLYLIGKYWPHEYLDYDYLSKVLCETGEQEWIEKAKKDWPEFTNYC